MDAPELAAVTVLSDWYTSQRIADRNPFEIDYGQTASPGSRNYASNYTGTVRIGYYHAGRKHSFQWHVNDDNIQSIWTGTQLDWSAQKEFVELLLVNYGFTDFSVLDWAVRFQGATTWVPVEPQYSFTPLPGTLVLGNYTGLSSSGYARLEGLSVDGNNVGVKGHFSLQGLCFPPSLQSLTDARITGTELSGLSTRIAALNTETEGSVILESACGTNLRWKGYVNIGFSSLARKAARRG
jgi:hypothetical protein